MDGADIRRLHQATPFQPFRIHMANGKSANIPHPEFMLLSSRGRKLVVEHADETFEIIDTSLVSSVETSPKKGNRLARQRKPKR